MNRIYLRFLFFLLHEIILSLKKQNWRYLSKNLYNLYIYIYINVCTLWRTKLFIFVSYFFDELVF